MKNRIYGLDILRACAIFTVLIGHSVQFTPEPFINFIAKYNIDGVTLFFVLSGFLIGQIILKIITNSQFSFRELLNFWGRRWLRTLPAFYLVAISLLIFHSITNNLPATETIIRCLTFTQNLFRVKSTFYFESWSLAVEEWFYLLIPFALYGFFKLFSNISKKKIFLFATISLIIVVTISRVIKTHQINYHDLQTWDLATRKPVFLRIDSIMFGMFGAYMYYYKLKIWEWKNFWFVVGMLIFLLIEFQKIPYRYYLVLTAESIGTLCLLPKLNTIKTGKGIVFKVVTFISIISYSLYLLNGQPFYEVIYPAITGNIIIPLSDFIYPPLRTYLHIHSDSQIGNIVGFICFYGWVFVSSFLLFKLVEKPFMNLRDKKINQDSELKKMSPILPPE